MSNKPNKITRIASVFAATLFLAVVAVSQAVANTIEDIKFSTLPGERFEVRVSFSEPPPEPTPYSIESPARIVFDFPGVDSAVARRHPLSVANASEAMVASDAQRTRLILNLNELTTYNSWVEGRDYVIDVGAPSGVSGVPAAAQTSQAVAQVTQNANAQTNNNRSRSFGGASNSITNIDFRRGEEGDGRVIINLANPNANIDMELVRGAIELRFEGLNIPDSLRNRLDVTDFATPVSYIEADSERSGALIRVEANGEYDYLAYQTDTEYVLSIKPLTRQELEEKQRRFAWTGEKISIDFQDIPVKSVLQIIANFQDFNLVTSDTVTGNIAVRLNNVPWDQALDVVLTSKGLDKRQEGNVLIVKPAAELAEQERQELETQRQLEELAPIRTEYIRVSYANAKEIFDLFGDLGAGGNGSLMSERGRVIVDERTNTIIITDTDDKISEVRALIDQLDVPIRQVLIEARIIIANADFREEIGVRWGGIGATWGNNHGVGASGSRDGLDSDPGAPLEFFPQTGGFPFAGGSTDIEENLAVDLGVTNPSGSFALQYLTSNVLLDLELSALEDTGQAEIVSQPKVITGDKQQAFIQQGQEVPYQEASASGATTTAFQEAVLKLEVTPQITPDNQIIMDLNITQDSIAAVDQASNVPILNITELETQVLVGNGDTIVLGGIYQTEQITGVTKVPFLGDIPYLGRLFRSELNDQSKRELLIFITPKILTDTTVR